MTLTAWLQQHHGVRDALFWEQAPHTALGGPYLLWDQSRKDDLRFAFDAAVTHQPTGLQDPPHNQLQLGDADGARTVLSAHDAWRRYVTTVAQSLASEIEKRVPWSIVGSPAGELAVLFDSRQFFSWNPDVGGYEIEFGVSGNATLPAPDTAYAFMHGLLHPPKPPPGAAIAVEAATEVSAVHTLPPLVVDPRVDAIEKILAWCRDNMSHYWGGSDAKNMGGTWHYRGLAPVERVIAGTHNTTEDGDNQFSHWTAGCHGTTGFLRAVLRTVNIPVEYTTQSGHAQPHFMHQSLWLDHGDDPYTSIVKAWPDGTPPPYPIGFILQGQTEHDDRFGPNVSDAQRAKNIERHILDLTITWLPTILLAWYCRDQAAGKSRADGEVFALFSETYSLHYVEQQHLWHRMDEKIAALGGVSAIPPIYY